MHSRSGWVFQTIAGRLLWAVACLGLIFLAATLTVSAQGEPRPDPSDEARRIALELQCPICEGQSVAESNSQLAVQMRAVIREKVEAGESREQILAYFKERYGEHILMEPPRAGFTTIAWVAPYVVVLATLAFLGWKIRGRREAAAASAADADPELTAYYDEVDRTYDAVRDEVIR
jgi:cytochrome c-type biogenesis protein CcmH